MQYFPCCYDLFPIIASLHCLVLSLSHIASLSIMLASIFSIGKENAPSDSNADKANSSVYVTNSTTHTDTNGKADPAEAVGISMGFIPSKVCLTAASQHHLFNMVKSNLG